MNKLLRTVEFNTWLTKLKDKIGKARIIQRLDAVTEGHFGDYVAVGNGVFEMRVHVGPGYRVYYMRSGKKVYLLLIGGDKSSQPRDIKQAIKMAKTLKKE